MANDVSQGQALVVKVEQWIKSFVVFPESIADASLVCALFAVNSWIYQVWDSTPYLCVTAATKGAAKTVLMEVIAFLCKGGKVVTDPTPAVLFRMLEAHSNWMVIAMDEAEKLSSESARTVRNFLNSGYRRGQTMPRSLPQGGYIDYPVYCPKIFALIGDVYSTLRDRSIVLTLQRATPAQLQGVKRYRYSDAEREASAIVRDIESVIKTLPAGRMAVTEATWVSGREEELWTPLLSTANALQLDRSMLDRLIRVSADLTALKTQDARRYTDLKAMEDDAIGASYGEKALRDLRRILRENEASILSAVAVERMRGLADGPWRTFKGRGLDVTILADLVSPFGLSTANVRVKGVKGSGAIRKGYRAKDIASAGRG